MEVSIMVVYKIKAGNNITVDPVEGVGDVTINSADILPEPPESDNNRYFLQALNESLSWSAEDPDFSVSHFPYTGHIAGIGEWDCGLFGIKSRNNKRCFVYNNGAFIVGNNDYLTEDAIPEHLRPKTNFWIHVFQTNNLSRNNNANIEFHPSGYIYVGLYLDGNAGQAGAYDYKFTEYEPLDDSWITE
jgi:hypothetical protein